MDRMVAHLSDMETFLRPHRVPSLSADHRKYNASGRYWQDGTSPIAVFIEYILGIKSDFSQERIEWDVRRTEAHGIERYPYGPESLLTLRAEARRSEEETPVLRIDTDVPFNLVVRWGDGEERTVRVEHSGVVKLK